MVIFWAFAWEFFVLLAMLSNQFGISTGVLYIGYETSLVGVDAEWEDIVFAFICCF